MWFWVDDDRWLLKLDGQWNGEWEWNWQESLLGLEVLENKCGSSSSLQDLLLVVDVNVVSFVNFDKHHRNKEHRKRHTQNSRILIHDR